MPAMHLLTRFTYAPEGWKVKLICVVTRSSSIEPNRPGVEQVSFDQDSRMTNTLRQAVTKSNTEKLTHM